MKRIVLSAGTIHALYNQNVVMDYMPKPSASFNMVKMDGYNGKGEEKAFAENVFTASTELMMASVDSSRAYLIGKTNNEGYKVIISDLEDEKVKYHAIFDKRNSSEPLAIFKKTYSKDGVESEKLSDKEIVLIAKNNDLAKEDILKSHRTIIALIKNKAITLSPAFYEEIKEVMPAKKMSQVYDFIAFFDNHFERTEEHIKAIRGAFAEADIAVPKGTFDKSGNLSDYFSPLKKDGLVIKSLSEAIDFSKIINGEIKEEHLDYFSQKLLKFSDAKNIQAISLVEGRVEFGVDVDGNMIVVEDTNIPYENAGSIYTNHLAEKLSEFADAKKVISNAHFAKLHEINPNKYTALSGKTPSENEIANAESLINKKAKEMATVLDEKNGEESLNDILAEHAPIVSLLGGMTKENDDAVLKAMKNLENQLLLIRSGAFKELITKDNTKLVKGGYLTKDDRQLGVANSSPKQPYGSRVDFKNDKVIALTTTLPTLVKTVGDDAVVNLKVKKIPMLQVVFDKAGKAKDIIAINTIGNFKKHNTLGRVLNKLSKLDPADENFSKKFKDMINYGGKIDDKSTNFGLLATKETQVGEYFDKSVIQPILDKVYTDNKGVYTAETLAEVKEEIATLANSQDYSVRSLGKQVMVLNALDNNMNNTLINNTALRALQSYSTDDKALATKEKVKDVMLRVINKEEVLPTRALTLSAMKLAEYANGLTSPIMEKVKNKELDSAIKLSIKMGYRQAEATSFKLIKETKDKKKYLSGQFYDETLLDTYDRENACVNIAGFKEVLENSTKLDVDAISEKNKDHQEYYDENKEVYVSKNAFYSEDEELGADNEIDLDLGGLEELIENASTSTEVDVLEQSARREVEDDIADELEAHEAFDAGNLFDDSVDIDEDINAKHDDEQNENIDNENVITPDAMY